MVRSDEHDAKEILVLLLIYLAALFLCFIQVSGPDLLIGPSCQKQKNTVTASEGYNRKTYHVHNQRPSRRGIKVGLLSVAKVLTALTTNSRMTSPWTNVGPLISYFDRFDSNDFATDLATSHTAPVCDHD